MATATPKTTGSLIHQKMTLVMASIGFVGKNQKNQFDGYMFRGIDAVYNAAQPALVEHGVFPTVEYFDVRQTDRTSRKGDPMVHTALMLRGRLYAEDGSYVECVVPGEALDRGDKSMNKAMSAAYKYFLFQVFCMPTEEAKDSENETHELGANAVSQESAQLTAAKGIIAAIESAEQLEATTLTLKSLKLNEADRKVAAGLFRDKEKSLGPKQQTAA